ncbi:MAG: radical SAM protein [Deltaproteobacteria bacterium]|nr:radical SAM protein [Deltaproteobacteria bacterium]
MMTYLPHVISWNLTRRCNLFCAHCYISALPGADSSEELTTEECRQVMDEIAQVNPNVFLILSGGEPLLRTDLFDLAAYAREKGFTVALGTNGILLGEKEARLMRQSGIQGAGISLDSADPKKHDAFRRLPGAWQGAIRATEVLRAEGIEFSIHTNVTSWNVDEIPAMIDLAESLEAKVLLFFFLVRTGRGQNLTDITAETYERVLTYLARVQGVGDGQPTATYAASIFHSQDDPWSVPTGQTARLLIRTRCAPHFRRIIYSLNSGSPLLRDYAQGSCPAGKYYCRITPSGDVTPCPYMPVTVGNLRQQTFSAIWQDKPAFNHLRDARLRGRCGACEFSRICGGCRCRAYATYGDYLAEDPACAYQPGQYGGRLITLSEEKTFGLEVEFKLIWEEAAKARLNNIPSFVRGTVVKAVEAFARSKGSNVVTVELMQEAKGRWARAMRSPFARN